MHLQALLVLEDGFSMAGKSFSGEGEVFGEVVFNTSMTGYQEMLTDPSYRGQLLTLTYPLIGNYGVNRYDTESSSLQVEALLVKENCWKPRSRRAEESLSAYLSRHHILGVEGIDTRTLTLHLRRAGTMHGVLSTRENDPRELERKLIEQKGKVARNLVGEVSCPEPYVWSGDRQDFDFRLDPDFGKRAKRHVVVLDFGVKRNILRRLAARNCRITVVPYHTSAAEIELLKPDGVLISNGPGDPLDQSGRLVDIRRLLGKYPLFGICLGHQLLALALGYRTYKLPFGHRGGNHPVKDLSTGRVHITSQNHGYCVRGEDMASGTTVTHVNLNDGTVEGLENPSLRMLSIQYHPEASVGPRDSDYLFDHFMALIDGEPARGGSADA